MTINEGNPNVLEPHVTGEKTKEQENTSRGGCERKHYVEEDSAKGLWFLP